MLRVTNTQRKLYRRCKDAGMTAQQVWDVEAAKIERAAKEQNWRPSERAMSLADVKFDLRAVYGKRVTRFLFEDAA